MPVGEPNKQTIASAKYQKRQGIYLSHISLRKI